MVQAASQTTVRLTSIAPQFIVPSVVQAAEFYRDKLGFSILGYYGNPPFYASVFRDAVRIHFRHDDRTDRDQSFRLDEEHLDAYIRVTGIDDLYAHCVAQNIQMVRPLGKMPWGATEFVIRDSSGYLLCFGEDR
jgi:catechol 2,3-dioxygenase-like lactoylglutathione lyase family enzyme